MRSADAPPLKSDANMHARERAVEQVGRGDRAGNAETHAVGVVVMEGF